MWAWRVSVHDLDGHKQLTMTLTKEHDDITNVSATGLAPWSQGSAGAKTINSSLISAIEFVARQS